MHQRMYSLYATPLRKMEEGYVEITSYSNKMEHPAILPAAQKHGFNEKVLKFAHGPSQSPDLNPIEHVWEEMKTKLENRPFKNVEELERAIFQCWQVID